ncbi:MAG: DUF1127 domain-containing protein [Vicinamibacterales bacterium]
MLTRQRWDDHERRFAMTRTLPNLFALLSSATRSSVSPHRIVTRLFLMSQVRRERSMLAKLDARALKDIGLSRADVECEAARPLWDLPARRDW